MLKKPDWPPMNADQRGFKDAEPVFHQRLFAFISGQSGVLFPSSAPIYTAALSFRAAMKQLTAATLASACFLAAQEAH
jgi:hypothetical protein